MNLKNRIEKLERACIDMTFNAANLEAELDAAAQRIREAATHSAALVAFDEHRTIVDTMPRRSTATAPPDKTDRAMEDFIAFRQSLDLATPARRAMIAAVLPTMIASDWDL